MAWVVEMLLPVRDPDGEFYPATVFDDLQQELTQRFGGVTAYLRAPAQGRWRRDDSRQDEDEVVLFEVMVADLEASAWRNLRRRLEQSLRQEKILMRAHEVKSL